MSSPCIQTAAVSSGGTCTFTVQNTAAGSLLIAVARLATTGHTGVAFSDNHGGVWTTVKIGSNIGTVDSYFGYALNTAGGTKPTISLNYSGGAETAVMCIGEYPAANASVLHTSAVLTTGATGTNPATPNVTPAVGDLLIGAWQATPFVTASTSAGTCGASATLSGKGTSGSNIYSCFEDGIAASASSQDATLTYASSSTYAGALFAFSPPSPAIQTAATSAAQSSSPATLAFTTQNTTAGSLLCGIVRYNSTGTLGAISDNQNSGNYTVVSLGTNGAVTSAFFYKLNTAGGSTPTISCVLTGTVGGVVIAIAEYPLSAAASLRTSNTGTATGTNPTTTAVSPVVGDLLIAAFGSTGGWTTSSLSAGTCGASATLHPGGSVSGATTFASLEDGVANSASSQTASITYGVSTAYMTGLFAFAPPASGGGIGTVLTSGAATPATVANSSGAAWPITSPTISGKMGQPTPIVFCDPNGNELAVTGSTKGGQIGAAIPVCLCTPQGLPITAPFQFTSNGNTLVVSATKTGVNLGRPIPVVLTDMNGFAYVLTSFSTFGAFMANPTPICLTDINGNIVTLLIAV